MQKISYLTLQFEINTITKLNGIRKHITMYLVYSTTYIMLIVYELSMTLEIFYIFHESSEFKSRSSYY